MGSPDRIYLQYDPDGETTWCEDEINDDDIEYVIATKLTQAKKEIERLKKLLSAAKHGLASYAYGNQSPEFAQEILKYLEGGE